MTASSAAGSRSAAARRAWWSAGCWSTCSAWLLDEPIEVFGRWIAVLGVLLLPLAAVGFVGAGLVWTLLIVWDVLVIAGLVVLSRRRDQPAASR